MDNKIRMNIKVFYPIVFLIFYSCTQLAAKERKSPEEIIFQQKDKQILEQVFEVIKDEKNTPLSELMIRVGAFFKETPYVAATLEINPNDEKLIINLREMDCTTFAENVLAISRSIKSGNPSFEKFAGELKNIRYRAGKIDTYTSRIHYFSDWIFENDRMKTVESVSKKIGGTSYLKAINFMSTHPDSYLQLKQNSELIRIIATQEKEISARKTYFIPEEKIVKIESQLMDGDIVGITSRVEGLDISHVGILVRKSGRVHLMHASTLAKKVIVSEETLGEYLLNSKSVTGIMVARPL
jgi:hypothetical protein